jgi:aminoglycoside phosphotransferase (APT) family kinase protein
MSELTDAISEWLEANIGGTVQSLGQQPRWRPTWFADVLVDGRLVGVCVRADRSDTLLSFSLDHEMRFQQQLHGHGVSVPEVYGWLDHPHAFAMELVAGRPDFKGVGPIASATIVDEYVQTLAQIHTLPIDSFVEAGIEGPADPNESAQFGWRKLVGVYRTLKRHPDPISEFALGWIDRHRPRSNGRLAPIVWDSGQFHHDGQHLVSVIDLELGHLGDPMMDLAGWRMRDSVIPFGDFDKIYERYGELVGEPVDREAIELHHIAFTLSNQLAFGHTLREPIPGSDYATNLQWCNETNLYVTEAIADYIGVELPTEPVPAPRQTRTAAASAHLARTLREVTTDDPVLRYRLRGAFRTAQHLARHDEIGAEILEADLDDLHELIGHRPADWYEGEEALEHFVLADRDFGHHDEQLVVFFHRRNLRAQLLNGPDGSAMARHNPIQRFPRREAIIG